MPLPRTFQDKLLSALAFAVENNSLIREDDDFRPTHEMVVRYEAGHEPTSGFFYVQRGWNTVMKGYFNFQRPSLTIIFDGNGHEENFQEKMVGQVTDTGSIQYVISYGDENVKHLISEFGYFVRCSVGNHN